MSDVDGTDARRRLALVDELRALGIADERVLAAIERVPRHRFVPPERADEAYANHALGIGRGQTISQPFVVATMSAALQLSSADRVLEIGTGSGYQAAVLAELAGSVDTIERDEELFVRARRILDELGYSAVRSHLGDGSEGLPSAAPFDAICVTAAAPRVPRPLIEQLAPGGRLVLPVGKRRTQVLTRIVQTAAGLRREELERVVFVPLRGVHGFPE